MNPIEKFIKNKNYDINNVNWQNTIDVFTRVTPLLKDLVIEPMILLDCLDYCRETKGSVQYFDSSEYFKRAKIYESHNNSFSIRLLSMNQLDDDIAHNHRATFCTYIIKGEYLHTIYETDLIDKPKAIFMEEIKSGMSYVIHHNSIHSTKIFKNHLSLTIRGRSVKENRVFYDPNKKKLIHVNGGSDKEKSQFDAKIYQYFYKSLKNEV